MPTNQPVTAQDFDADAICNKLFDNCYADVPFDQQGFKNFHEWLTDQLSQSRQQAFQEGRKQGLKEMDEAHIHGEDKYGFDKNDEMFRNPFRGKITELRHEYQQPN